MAYLYLEFLAQPLSRRVQVPGVLIAHMCREPAYQPRVTCNDNNGDIAEYSLRHLGEARRITTGCRSSHFSASRPTTRLDNPLRSLGCDVLYRVTLRRRQPFPSCPPTPGRPISFHFWHPRCTRPALLRVLVSNQAPGSYRPSRPNAKVTSGPPVYMYTSTSLTRVRVSVHERDTHSHPRPRHSLFPFPPSQKPAEAYITPIRPSLSV
ncbi:hypothetical protein F5Y03DRAFT_315497 [Xylaria venustula]|nr:hypothetical protein F5Y03DRAFT_315497 [Xylaria venustula]